MPTHTPSLINVGGCDGKPQTTSITYREDILVIPSVTCVIALPFPVRKDIHRLPEQTL